MDIVFASSKGSQYRYFKTLCSMLQQNCALVTLVPTLAINFFGSGLNREIINQGIDFHIQRKKRKYHDYTFLPEWFWSLYRVRAQIKFSLIYLRFERFFSVHHPKVVGLWNGHRLPEMAIKAAAKRHNVKVAHFENGLLPDTTTLDFNGVNAFNSVPRKPSFYHEYLRRQSVQSYRQESLEVREAHKNRKELNRSVLSVTDRYVFVPFQVNFDSQLIINSPQFPSNEHLYRLLDDASNLLTDPDIKIVIKEHPSDPRIYSDLHELNSRIVFSTDNTEALIRNAEAVITLNSSVGLESIMLEKRVVVLGNACFNVSGVTKQARSASELASILNGLSSWSPNERLQRAFITYLRNDYCIPGAWQRQIGHCDAAHARAISKRFEQDDIQLGYETESVQPHPQAS